MTCDGRVSWQERALAADRLNGGADGMARTRRGKPGDPTIGHGWHPISGTRGGSRTIHGVRVRRPDGVERYIEAAAYMTTAGAAATIVGMIRDVTSRRRQSGKPRTACPQPPGERVKERACSKRRNWLQRIGSMDRDLLAEIRHVFPRPGSPGRTASAHRLSGDGRVLAGLEAVPWTQPFLSTTGGVAVEVASDRARARGPGPFLTEERALIESLSDARSHIEEQVTEQQRRNLKASCDSPENDALGTWRWHRPRLNKSYGDGGMPTRS